MPSGGLVGDWQVGGRTIHVTSATRIDQEHGQATVGARVEVKGTAQSDGSITASTVEVKSSSSGGDSGSSSTGEAVSFKGAIESLPSGLMGDWTISGRTVHVTSLSQLRSEHGSFAVGVRIKGKGVARTDGSVDASKIQVRE
ncbi:MAG: hypothetical protein HY231_04570 [Acidobacteria bacterium]|nr:hypothetical protein [Acidobacteriota bacterium]